jgi:formate-dependent nitrite reductase membrane component NrfD
MFFAGVGSGLSFVVFVLDSFLGFFKPRLFKQCRPLIAPGHMTGLALVALGAVFLFFDLGRADRLLDLFLNPRLTVLVCGAWSLLLFVALVSGQLVLRLRIPEETPRPVHIAVRWAGAASALAVMSYTGILLWDLHAVHFWNSFLLPVLFLLSSLSGGLALVMLLGFIRQDEGVPFKHMAVLTKAHLPLMLTELLVLAAYLVLALQRSPVAAASAKELLSGTYSLLFWGGVVLCGFAAPFVLGLLARRKLTEPVLAQYSLSLLAGALALRYCFLVVGAHPAM